MSPTTCNTRIPIRIHSASRFRRFSAATSTARKAPYARFGGAGNSTLSTNRRTGCTCPNRARPTAEVTHSSATTSSVPAVMLGILPRHRRTPVSSCWNTLSLPGRGSAMRGIGVRSPHFRRPQSTTGRPRRAAAPAGRPENSLILLPDSVMSAHKGPIGRFGSGGQHPAPAGGLTSGSGRFAPPGEGRNRTGHNWQRHPPADRGLTQLIGTHQHHG